MLQFKIDGKRLKKLMEDNNINAYQLSKEIGGYPSPNTIINYMNESTPPKSLEYVKTIADFFNVSTDFLLGLAPTSTNNIDIKGFCNKYGLTENSLSALKLLNEMKTDWKRQTIDTINYLLEDISINKQNSIINVITDYLFFTNINSGIKIPIKSNSEAGVTEVLTVEGNTAVKSILIKEIEDKLNWLKDEIKKEGENDEHKRKSKK